MANNSFMTTGLRPLTIGSVEIFELQATQYGILPWDLTNGIVSLMLLSPPIPITAPLGNSYSVGALISGGVAKAQWTVIGPEGTWRRAWNIVDQFGVKQISRPIPFQVVNSPGP